MGVIQNAVNQALGAAAKASVGIKGLKELEANKNAPTLEKDKEYIKLGKELSDLKRQQLEEKSWSNQIKIDLRHKTIPQKDIGKAKEALYQSETNQRFNDYQIKMKELRMSEVRQKYKDGGM